MPLKNCLDCSSFHFRTGWGGSDVTPGEMIEIGCNLGHWELRPNLDTEEDFRKKMTTAETCKDYDPRD